MPRYLILVLAVAAIAGCGESHNPVSDLPENTAMVIGNLYDEAENDGLSVTLHGKNMDYHAITDNSGNYFFHDVPFGTYTIVSGTDGYSFYPENYRVTVDNTHVSIPDLIGYVYSQTVNKIIGFVREKNGRTITLDNSVSVWLNIEKNGISLPLTQFLSPRNGTYPFVVTLPDNAHATYTLKARIDRLGGDSVDTVRIEPDSAQVVVDAPAVFQDIGYSYDGEQYTVSGYIEDSQDVWGLSATVNSVDYYVSTNIFSDGFYAFAGVPEGRYSLKFPLYEILSDLPDSITVTGDMILPALQIRYIGPNEVTIHGRVMDHTGIGIPQVSVARLNALGAATQQVMTDDDGYYELLFEIKPDRTVSGLLRVTKPGVDFVESEYSLHLSWEPAMRERKVDVPVFIGTDYSSLIAPDFFPLDTVSSWTYRRTADGAESDVTVTLSAEGDGWYRFDPSGAAGFREFRIVDGEVRVRNTGSAEGTLLRWGVTPGTTWKVFPDEVFQVWNGEFLGLGDVTVPAGTYNQCAVFEAGIDWDAQSETSYTLWFARDIGLVKMSRVSRSMGGVVESRVDELTGTSQR